MSLIKMHLTRAVLCLLLLSSTAFAQQSNSWTNDPQIESRVEKLLQQMTQEEKIGQLVQYSGGEATGPAASRGNYKELVAQGKVGSLFNVTGPAQTNALQKIAVEKSRLHIPLIFGLDVIHGYRTTFPVPLAMSATWNPDIVERAAGVAAREARRDGVNWTFSPMVDIARDARWGRITEGNGEDTYLGSAMAAAYIRGYQGKDMSNPDKVAACTKHFVGYGAAEGGRDYNTTEIPVRLLRQVYLPPFQATVDAGVATFMSAFNDLNEVPASANAFTLTQVLRKEWGFKGFVVSDWGSIGELIPHGIATSGAQAAGKAFLAGVDMDMESDLYGKNLPELVKAGIVPQSTIDEAVRRILRVKFALGLFDKPYVEGNGTMGGSIPSADLELARTVAEQSFVLLKNDGVLPIRANAKTVALIGPMGDDAGQMIGSWGGLGNARDVTTLRAALESRLKQGGGRVIYAKGTEFLTDSTKGFNDAVAAAKQADVVIMTLGEDAPLMTGEAGSRTRLDLPGNQEQLLETVAATGKPVVLLVFSGRPLILNWAAQHVPAIMEAWYPGVQAGPALVRTLFGDVNPSGKLTTSFPRAVGQEPLYYNHLNTGRPAGNADLSHPPRTSEEKYLSRYIDEQNSPLYPFGYGLSYTTFSYSPTTVSTQSASAAALNSGSGKITVSAEVSNTGKVQGDEVVQLYVREVGTSVSRPVRELKGFRRITLAPGASQKVEFTVGADELRFWGIDMKNVVEPSQVTVWIAPDSTKGTEVHFAITQ